ncbi:MAG: RDD family protein [Chitinophagaceae bacterium]
MNPEIDLLQDLEQQYEDAPVGQRFLNYIVDVIAYYAILYLAGIVIGIIIVASGATFGDTAEPGQDRGAIQLYLLLLGYLSYVIFMAVSEGLGKGRSLGKLVTRTTVIRDDGAAFTWKDAFLRSLSRVVPFEPFSALGGYPWHDKWTHTRVVKLKK